MPTVPEEGRNDQGSSGEMTVKPPEEEAMPSAFRHVRMTGPDKRMDQREPFEVPVNPIPVKCPRCTFPDLDFVPEPYFLAKGTSNPNEIDLAEFGNFFVRQRCRQILEAVAPGQCHFFPTHDLKTKKETAWFLAVPTTLVRTATVKPAVPRCPDCGEPKVAHPGSQYDFPSEGSLGERPFAMANSAAKMAGTVAQDVFKSLNWSSCATIGEESRWYYMHFLGWKKQEPSPPYQWTRVTLARELYFSLRLQTLFKKVGIKGLNVYYVYTEKPNPDELAWVDQMQQLLVQQGLARKPPVKRSSGVEKWFSSFLKKNKSEGRAEADFAGLEKAHGVQLPPSYKEFISTVGEMTFQDMDDGEGFTVHILSPEKMNFQRFRKGNTEFEDEESREIDGIIFASTDHFDCFCFDLSNGPEYPVYLFNDELGCFEAYTSGFKECIKRFSGG